MYQGFFLAPHVVCTSFKRRHFYVSNFRGSWYEYQRHVIHAKRTDLIQSVSFQTAAQMIQFCQAIQLNSPVNAQFAPEPAYMPGYEDDVIMAAGTFVQGSSIELSADGPIDLLILHMYKVV